MPVAEVETRVCYPIDVLYEDEYYIVFNKPAGFLVIPTPKKEKHTLIDIVNRPLRMVENHFRLHLCHRLDRDTSGVILFAKGKKNQRLMMEEFRKQAVRKRYIALVQGRLRYQAGEMKSAIGDYDEKRFRKKSFKRMAVTRYRVLKRKKYYSIIEVYPLTGRTNQIRIHLSQLGHPLVGERKYAFARDFPLKFSRTALHASELQWCHPVWHRWIVVKAPLPNDMEEFIAKN